jgi:hypothetical protein
MKSLKILFLSLLAVSMIACSDDDTEPTSITMTDLAGSWTANASVHTNNANSSETFNLITNNGEIRYTGFADGRVRMWYEFGDVSDEWDALWTISGNKITATPAESTRPILVYMVEVGTNAITLTNVNDSFDFTLTGVTAVPTKSVTVFVPH